MGSSYSLQKLARALDVAVQPGLEEVVGQPAVKASQSTNRVILASPATRIHFSTRFDPQLLRSILPQPAWKPRLPT